MNKQRYDQQDSPLPVCQKISDLQLYFEKIEQKGKGGFGSVYSARVTPLGKTLEPSLPDIVAIKKMTIQTDRLLLYLNEFAVLKRITGIKSVRSMKYYGCFVQGDFVFLVMELVDGRTLLEEIVANEEMDIHLCNTILRELALGITEIHALNIVHRDIKLENVMLTEAGSVKLIDFGLACDMLENPQMYTCIRPKIGTMKYMDPTLQAGGVDLTRLKLADWWAFGQLANQLYRLGGLRKPEVLHLMLTSLTDPSLKPEDRVTASAILASLDKL
jgi:serine/threonine protein kinase